MKSVAIRNQRVSGGWAIASMKGDLVGRRDLPGIDTFTAGMTASMKGDAVGHRDRSQS
jgi:hypothetical protein